MSYTYLNFDHSWNSETMHVFMPIISALICFVLYWFTAQSTRVKNYFYVRYDPDTASTYHIFFTKIFGFFSMGIIPAIFSLWLLPDFAKMGFGLVLIPQTNLFTLAWTLGLCLLVVPLASFSARKPKNLLNYPQIRAKKWTNKTLALNLIGWALYLFGYEFLFRGLLFIPLVAPIGFWGATAINIALYSATHIPKGMEETIGAIPLGLVLCLLTAASGNIWIAVIVHVAMSWSNSLTALKFHPEIHYVSHGEKVQ